MVALETSGVFSPLKNMGFSSGFSRFQSWPPRMQSWQMKVYSLGIPKPKNIMDNPGGDWQASAEQQPKIRHFLSRWWFQIFFIFIPIWGNDPI